MIDPKESETAGGPPTDDGGPRTVAEALGQVTWLMSQSRLHRRLPIEALEHSFMPAILKRQVRIFRFGPLPSLADVSAALPEGFSKKGLEDMPLGAAIWGRLSDAAEAKLERGEKLDLADWDSGDRLWLIELLAPFATPENKLVEAMLLDLMQNVFGGRGFSLHRTDTKTGKRERVRIGEGSLPQ